MQLVVTITIAKNGYFVRYPKLTIPETRDVAGAVEVHRQPFMVPLDEETLIATDEQEIVKLLQELRRNYHK